MPVNNLTKEWEEFIKKNKLTKKDFTDAIQYAQTNTNSQYKDQILEGLRVIEQSLEE